MIPYSRDPQHVIPTSSVKIIGLGGAGTNMLERIALDSMDGASLLALNTDIRTLDPCLAGEKIQLGKTLTKGLGTGGDPELGQLAVQEAESAIREAIKGQRIVFICTGLGGGTGSGAAPFVTRIAREEGAFVVVFATMPFTFEGRRRRDQAETSLNELAVLSNALVTFDNNRMGELVLAKQGIHEAFVAADQMICESIKAVIRLVARPGLINVGLDDLMSALRTTRSRCLFGSGMAEGKDRTAKALRAALASPLLDQGSLLKEAQTVLVHLCGGPDLTLYEIELIMQNLGKVIPETAHVLFGAAVDPNMGNKLSLTLISALPEDSLAISPRESPGRDEDDQDAPPSIDVSPLAPMAVAIEPTISQSQDSAEPEEEKPLSLFDNTQPFAEAAVPAVEPAKPAPEPSAAEPEAAPELTTTDEQTSAIPTAVMVAEFVALSETESSSLENCLEAKPAQALPTTEPTEEPSASPEPAGDDSQPIWPPKAPGPPVALPPKRDPNEKPWTSAFGPKTPEIAPELSMEPEPPKLKLGIKPSGSQSELSLDSAPRGRFDGESPNVVDGEDLDLPPFLRKKK